MAVFGTICEGLIDYSTKEQMQLAAVLSDGHVKAIGQFSVMTVTRVVR